MRKNVFGRRFKRDSNERKSLFKSLMTSLVLDEKIQTTEAKAKSIKGHIEKLVTKAKKREGEAKRFLSAHLMPAAVDKVINRIAPQFKNRPGGYTRIVRLGNRVSDSASMVVMEWVETIQNLEVPLRSEASKSKNLKIDKKIKKAIKTVAKRKTVIKKPTSTKKSVSKIKAKPKSKK